MVTSADHPVHARVQFGFDHRNAPPMSLDLAATYPVNLCPLTVKELSGG